jgi:hypothetical protein
MPGTVEVTERLCTRWPLAYDEFIIEFISSQPGEVMETSSLAGTETENIPFLR